mmetsp:Transcript_35935/g.107364  ORF Transcript_35935/g.107364 Transcript_35935/m.107364 type:complete len:240 (-) Transcript_35935:117-836(-)
MLVTRNDRDMRAFATSESESHAFSLVRVSVVSSSPTVDRWRADAPLRDSAFSMMERDSSGVHMLCIRKTRGLSDMDSIMTGGRSPPPPPEEEEEEEALSGIMTFGLTLCRCPNSTNGQTNSSPLATRYTLLFLPSPLPSSSSSSAGRSCSKFVINSPSSRNARVATTGLGAIYFDTSTRRDMSTANASPGGASESEPERKSSGDRETSTPPEEEPLSKSTNDATSLGLRFLPDAAASAV